MTGRVIQGSFFGGQPKLAAVQPRTAPPPMRAKTMARPSGPPATAFAVRPSGPPATAFSGRLPAAPAFAGQQGTPVQRHVAPGAFAVDAGPLGLVSSGGRPLPEAVRGKMEAALGADFSSVRVHVGPQAERIGAIAFTVGSDIYFAPGRYQPDTIHGQQLLGHELTHVVQQRAGRVRNPLGSGLAVVQDHALEAEADRLGQRAAMHRVAAQAKFAPSAVKPPLLIASPSIVTMRSSTLANARPIGPDLRTNRVAGPGRGVAVQRIKAIYDYKWKYARNEQERQEYILNQYDKDEDDLYHVKTLRHYVSSFSNALTIDQTHGVITQAQQNSWPGHSELFVEYLDGNTPKIERVHFAYGTIAIGPYSTTSADWRTRLPRGSSWRVSDQDIQNALGTANLLKQGFDRGKLDYSEWFGTTIGWKNATTSKKVSMGCKDVTDAILIEVGILLGRNSFTTWFNRPGNIAGHTDRNSVAPDDTWQD